MELTQDEIIDWAMNYASDKELEDTAKAIYSLYANRRPADKKAHDKTIAISIKKKKNFRYPKGYRKYAPALVQNKTIPYTEIRK